MAALAAGLALGGGVLLAPSAYALTGIVATGSGPGALTVSAPAPVTETNGDGIQATNNSPGTSLTITATDVSGSEDGIDARNNGTGTLSVTSTGNVTAVRNGIFAQNFGTYLSVAGTSVSGNAGVVATNAGTGSLSVSMTGTVTGTDGRGIAARNQGPGFNLRINVAGVTGTTDGIYADNAGRGELRVTSTGSVAGTSRYGVFARNSNAGTNLTVRTTSVSGGISGIFAQNSGTGAFALASTGDVTGGNTGILGSNSGTYMTVTGTSASGGIGVDLQNDGTGTLTLSMTGNVTGTSGNGVVATNQVTGSDMGINLAGVTGANHGIYARNLGTGTMSVTATGTVTGTIGNGVAAYNYGTNLSLATASVSGARHGINAVQYGTGALRITSTGTVTGSQFNGISATNTGVATDEIRITTASVSGVTEGIFAQNLGSGSLFVTSTGVVSGTIGISASNFSSLAGELGISAAQVDGQIDGISAINNGSGGIFITSSGLVTGQAGIGIQANNGANATDDLSITADRVIGGVTGIVARNYGTGMITVTATGNVTGGGDGILALNTSGTELVISVAGVTGGMMAV